MIEFFAGFASCWLLLGAGFFFALPGGFDGLRFWQVCCVFAAYCAVWPVFSINMMCRDAGE